MRLLNKIIQYYNLNSYTIDRNPGEINICYIEGMNADGTLNTDAWDRWNDRRIVFTFDEGGIPDILINHQCTTEPGRRPTFSLRALKRGGVFRIAFGQYQRCWLMGHHKGNAGHPALVQAPEASIWGHRDRNRDGFRTGDLIDRGYGINQHGTQPGFAGKLVDMWSEGCLVGRYWAQHLQFIAVCKSDPRYMLDNTFRFTATIIPGNEL